MRRLAEGDRDAFAALVRRHQGRVLSLAYRFLNRWDAAEDVGQEVFLRVLRSAASYRPEAEFSTWLYRVVANLCWDERRKARSARAALIRFARRPEPDGSPTQIDADERSERVRAAVAALPDRQRLALLLHRFAGLGHAEIADATGWSRSAVESCLVRAYARLRDELSEMAPEKETPRGAAGIQSPDRSTK